MNEKLELLRERRKLLRELINIPDTLENEQKLDIIYWKLDSIRKQLEEIEMRGIENANVY